MNAASDRVRTSTIPREVEKALRDLLEGTFITAIRYASGFGVEFAREGKPPAPQTAMVAWLTFRSNWTVGSASEWEELLSKAPWPLTGGEVNDPMRAYVLTWLCGAVVEGVSLGEGGGLRIVTSQGKDIALDGTDDVFEESWIVDVPRDVPNSEYWSVTCDSRGSLYARMPRG